MMAPEPTNANSGIQGPAQLFTLIISLLARTLVSSEHNSLVTQSGTLYLSDQLEHQATDSIWKGHNTETDFLIVCFFFIVYFFY